MPVSERLAHGREAVAWLLLAAGAGFVPLATRGVPDGVAEAVECLWKTFAFANLNAAWQVNASSRLTRGPGSQIP
jgi:hypothetical protein